MNQIASAVAVLDDLVAAGIRDAVLCPGSRSTPLALALDAHPDIQLHIHIDERGAAFHALGTALGSGRPGLVVTTSGTAVSNLLPALTEAHQANVPLVALTADRPPRLRHTGANQTIEQPGIFEHVCRASIDLPVPEELVQLPPIVTRALATHPAGPVHINMPFEKPLEPTAEEHALLEALRGRTPKVRDAPSPARPEGRIPSISLGHLGRGVIVCGPGTGASLAPWLRRLSDALEAPIIADALSGVRGILDAVTAADRFADHPDLPKPDWVVQFGATPTSRTVARYIAQAGTRLRFDWSGRGWDDLGECTMSKADPARWMERAIEQAHTPASGAAWRHAWHEMDAAVRPIQPAPDDEAAWVSSVLAGHPERLFVGNSMPVRDLERYGHPQTPMQVFGNRGASGIDGTIATACGIAHAGPTTAVIGDLAFAHDQSSLLLWHEALRLIVIDNGGGRIFEHLPIAQATTRFEDLFATPQRLDIAKAARAAGVPVHRAEASKLSRPKPGLTIVKTEPGQAHRRQRLHRQAHEAAGAVLAQHL